MTRAEDLVKQASAVGLKPVTDFFITPGSELIRATLDRDETLSTFTDAGGVVLSNACGPWYVSLCEVSFKSLTLHFQYWPMESNG